MNIHNYEFDGDYFVSIQAKNISRLQAIYDETFLPVEYNFAHWRVVQLQSMLREKL